ncbi:MAG: DNA polymerase I [Armatimonadetes bacterium]|nr:DNA polymerase I [Armatimonadota bacterium]
MSKKSLVIIDGFSLLFRAFYGTRYLSTSDGRPTNALFGFVSMLYQLIESRDPDAIVVALDSPGKTFRHAEYAEYKGTRRETPQELISQLEVAREMISAFEIPVIELTGYEADDIVGTISRLGEENGYETTIVTGDLDSLQLVDDHVTVMTTKRGVTDVVFYSPEGVHERYGFGPEFVTDYKALVGDTSDNIPGVPGIGDKSATILIQEFGTIEQIMERIDEVPEKFRKKIVGNEEQMKKSKWLATILRDVPIEYNFKPYEIDQSHLAQARDMMTRFEFRSHAKRLDQVLGKYLTGADRGTSVVKVSEERIPFKLQPKITKFENLDKWVGEHAFAVLAPAPPEQGSLLNEQASGLGHVAIDGQVATAPWEDIVRLFHSRPHLAIGHDTKPLYHQGEASEVAPNFDVTLAAYVLQSGRSSYDLKEIAQAYLDFAAPESEPELAASLLHLKSEMGNRLVMEDQMDVYRDVELALIPILSEMERTGIVVSGSELGEFSAELQEEITKIQSRIWEIAGEEFNIGSPKQIGEMLFDKMQLPGGKKTKTGWATGVEILGEMAVEHEIAKEILSYRELTKLKSTYADALPKLIDKRDGRIHTTFNQAVAATGRLSSIDPNLQNIPIRTELGRQIRKSFQAGQGYTLGSFDYSQIELRILAHMCGDENLVEAFTEGIDVHTVTASLMFDESQESVSKEHRRLAKMLNYAVLYGVTGFGLANQLGAGFGVEDAGRLIKQYNERFPKVKQFTLDVIEEAKSKGFTVTMKGRRRYFPDIHAGNRVARAYAERQATNAPIQGTAADMIKIAMLDVAKLIKDSPSRMLLQVHDELVFELAEDKDQLIEPIRKAMEDALPLSVPVEVDAKVGQNWLEMQIV